MLSIQDVGLSILGDTPKNLYILGGSEYGIKDKYIDILCSKVGPQIQYPDFMSVLNLMTGFHIIPLQPQVYVVRYDKTFFSKLNPELVQRFNSLNIVGTIVLLYEDDADVSRLDKYFPDNTAIIDVIDSNHMIKYLCSDFPDLDKNVIKYAATRSTNYYQAKNICRCLNCVKDEIVLTESQIISLFDLDNYRSNNDIQIAIASRNFRDYTLAIDNYNGELTMILYQILKTMIELDKLMDNKYTDSPLKTYVNEWTRPDIYYMFNHTYNVLQSLRRGNNADIKDILIYLGSLFKFKRIPSLEALQ
jgi:hypothetical protein